ncbi:FAD-binding protein [Leptospira ognonensis]|uniref:FAD-binding protein n=1 Tax=Leptospira ognonensis TaxID=2484945 RepID=A0A4R9JV27_9LEPT|nr:NAD(P)/FAD-dependent oxidoreductase [Leptospira ognonensis]TGL56672.1 FAD-binding protein [Leptospira ognonensis]
MEKIWDYVIIGSGMGGLSAGAVLAKNGQSVLVLERGSSPGGCCSSFKKGYYVFEAGATTLVGFEEGLPMSHLERLLGIEFAKRDLPLSMQVHINGETIQRYSDRKLWIEECIRVFGTPLRQKMFWNFTFFLSSAVWDISKRYLLFPFRNIKEVILSLSSVRWIDPIAFIFSLLRTEQVLALFGLKNQLLFKKFLTEQLMITNQCGVKEAPFLSAAAGLTYPNLKNFYVDGGMVELPNTLIRFICEHSGEYQSKAEVVSFERVRNVHDTELWHVKTKNKEFFSLNLISNVPIWNLAQLHKEKEDSLTATSKSFNSSIWGAFTAGIALKANIPKEECLHHQLHVNGQNIHGIGDSVFVSLSHAEDEVRSKEGVRILSLSTHLAMPEKWDRRSSDYQQKKKEVMNLFIRILSETFPWFRSEDIVFLHTATPATWSTWTGRLHGRVGGIPSQFFRNPFRYISPVTQIPNFYLTGDTIYPGQGVPAVVLGGMNLAKRILKNKERLILR